jgi:putative membrane protein
VVTGIGDFSPHTVHGDFMIDVTGAVAFVELEPYADAAGDALWLEGQAVERFGPETAHWIDGYRRFYGFYFSDAGDFDPALYGWCLRQLDRP